MTGIDELLDAEILKWENQKKLAQSQIDDWKRLKRKLAGLKKEDEL